MLKKLEEKLKQEKHDLRINAEKEKNRIEHQVNLAEDEKKELLERLKVQSETQEKQKTKQQNLIKKLKKMEDKVLVGHQVMEEARKQAKELKKTKKLLHKEKIEQQKLRNRKEQADAHIKHIKKKFDTMKEEIDYLTSKMMKYQELQVEINDMQEEFSKEKQGMYDTIFDLENQLQLKETIIDAFVPETEVKKL